MRGVEAVLSLLITAHLLGVGVAMMAPFLAVGLEWKASRRRCAVSRLASLQLMRVALASLLIGVALGFAILGWILMTRSLDFQYGVAKLPASRWGFMIAELLFAALGMWAYFRFWDRMAGHRWWHRFIALAVATNLVYHFPPLFVMLTVVRDRPELADLAYNHREYLVFWRDSEIVLRIVHHWLTALVAAGIALVGVVLKLSRHAEFSEAVAASAAGTGVDGAASEPEALLPAWSSTATIGAGVALVASILQFPIGFGLVMSLSATSQASLFGGNLLRIGLFATAIAAAIGMMHHLATICLGQVGRKEFWLSLLLLITTVGLMVYSSQIGRLDLKPLPDLAGVKVE